MPEPRGEQRHVVVVRELVAGTSLITACGFAAVVLSPDPAGRVVVIAVGCAVCAVWCSDWLARVGVTVLAGFIYAMFVAHQAGMPAAWPYTPVIGLAALLGAGYRRLAHAEADYR